MSSFKCPTCGLVNWSTATECKRCRNSLSASAGDGYQQPTAVTNEQFVYQGFEDQIHRQQNPHWDRPYVVGECRPNYNLHAPPPMLKTGLALTAMIVGILSIPTTFFLIGVLLAPLALIIGITGLVKANRRPNEYGGKGYAIAGICTSSVALVFFLPIIAAIAIPNLLAARRAANEGSAISVLRKLNTGAVTYVATGAGACGDFGRFALENLSDPLLVNREHHGYRFSMKESAPGRCEFHAVPISESTGRRKFMVGSDGVIRYAETGVAYATEQDPSITEINRQHRRSSF